VKGTINLPQSNLDGNIPITMPEISHSVLVRADSWQVYNALTTAEGLDAWFTHGAVVDAHPGGEIRFRWVDFGPQHISTHDGGPVLEAIPPSRFVFQWHPDQSDYATTVKVDISPGDNGTIVSLREYGFPPSALKAMLNCATGWGEALTMLKFYLEHGVHY
jgi:uncharacterized protein YndB with AHSA1/START domain